MTYKTHPKILLLGSPGRIFGSALTSYAQETSGKEKVSFKAEIFNST